MVVQRDGRLKALSEAFPWPPEPPRVDPFTGPPGWLGDGPRQVFQRDLSASTGLVVELGAWLGMSTRFIARHAPNATVVAVDHWQGSSEHRARPDLQDLLPRLFDTFLAQSWPYRDRIIPLPMTTLDGLKTLADYGLSPDLIYVDAEHSYEAVLSELSLARQLFPEAVLVGDDYNWAGVRKAVDEFAGLHGSTVEVVGDRLPAWKLLGPRIEQAGEDG